MKRFVVRTGLEPVAENSAFTLTPPDYINISSSTFYSQHRGIVYNLARLTAVWELKFTNVNGAGHA